METFTYRSRIEASAEEAFRWHVRPGAMERLIPPWERVTVLDRTGGLEPGSRVTATVGVGPLRCRWLAEHTGYDPVGLMFRDRLIRGPLAAWEHTHRFEPDGPEASVLEDAIRYALPAGPIGHWLIGRRLRRKLERIFAYRHRVAARDLALHRRCGASSGSHVVVTGSSGFIGSALVPFLTTAGHRVTRLVRRRAFASRGELEWDPASGKLDTSGLSGVDAVIHLAGDNIASGRWTSAKKARILASRLEGTRVLCEGLARLPRPPRVLVCASAIGYYGNRGEERLTEDSPPGQGFLAQTCREWEAAADAAVRRGIRVVYLRFGVVLSPSGGPLKLMLPPFRLGVGGPLGSGRQYFSWVAIDDVLGAVAWVMAHESLRGPVNVVAPQPVTNLEFTRTLAAVLRRPAVLPAPAPALRLVFGELADAALLGSARVIPSRLLASGYPFAQAELGGALRHLLGRV